MSVLAPLILIIGFSNVFGVQYLIPTGKNFQFTLGVLAGAITNLGLNFLLIPKLWSLGAAIATISGELVVTIVMAIMVRKTINFLKIILDSWRYFMAGGAMFLVLFFINGYFESSIINTILLVLIGIAIYFAILLILRDKVMFLGINKVKAKLFKKKVISSNNESNTEVQNNTELFINNSDENEISNEDIQE